MKCPKCGSVMKGVYDRKYNRKCFNCGTIKKVDIKELEHQQRLDNVLSKFEKNRNPKSNEYYYHYKESLLMAIDIDRESKFSLYHDSEDVGLLISLNTVESLIKDLEDNDG